MSTVAVRYILLCKTRQAWHRTMARNEPWLRLTLPYCPKNLRKRASLKFAVFVTVQYHGTKANFACKRQPCEIFGCTALSYQHRQHSDGGTTVRSLRSAIYLIL